MLSPIGKPTSRVNQGQWINGRDYGTHLTAGSAQRWERAFIDPVLYKEDGQVFTTIWFTRGVCGLGLVSYKCSSAIVADVSPHPDFATRHRSLPGPGGAAS